MCVLILLLLLKRKLFFLNVATFPPTHYRASPHFSQQKKKYLEIPDKPIKLRELFIVIDNRKCDGL